MSYRKRVVDAFVNMLKADTTTLYGKNKLVTYISGSAKEFEKAKTDIVKKNCLYAWSETSEPVEIGSQNSLENYMIDLVIHTKSVNIDTAIEQLDLIWEQVKYLTNFQMWGGNLMDGYFTSDSLAHLYLIEAGGSSLPAPESKDDQRIITIIESEITIGLNLFR